MYKGIFVEEKTIEKNKKGRKIYRMRERRKNFFCCCISILVVDQ